MILGQAKDWWEGLGFQVLRVRVEGHYKHVKTPLYSTVPDWLLRLEEDPATFKMTDNTTNEEGWFYAQFEFDAGNALWAEPTKIYRPQDYDFLRPPEGFAGALAASQAFAPVKGAVELAEASEGYPDELGKVVNITGGLPEWSTMKAMISGVEYQPGTGRRTLRLGPPPRYDFRSLVQRMRRAPADNIEYL